ncbi:MAG: glycosyltransferase family 39 protein [Chloroflexi bacterium]|nr:glycosyltransferase family 39 protein [Chloroflexota bacterium]MCC6895805.1 glycosyltransferase family 39 protein [Anaerolineae bacterium]
MPSTTSTWLSTKVVGVVLCVILIPLMLLKLDVYPTFWYDEGYTIQVSQSILQAGVYGTYNATEGYRVFDPTISSGPMTILPITLAFKLFGISIFAARLITVLYGFLGLFMAYQIAQDLFGRNAALIAILAMLFPGISTFEPVGYLQLSRQVLGEVPSFALIFMGLWLWFRSWERGQWSMVICAGLLMGVGVVSKPQVVFSFGPAIGIIALIRTFFSRRELLRYAPRYILPPALVVAVFGGWTLFQRLGMTDALRAESAPLLAEAMQLHFFTGLMGSTVSTTGWIITGVMVFSGVASLVILYHQRKAGVPLTNQQWGIATLALIPLVMAAWYALFSVGFERYTFMGFMVSLLLLGNIGYQLIVAITKRLRDRDNLVYVGIVAALLVLITVGNAYSLANHWNDRDNVDAMADYIDANVPDDEIVESLEVELNSLTQHREMHRASYSYIYEAIRQLWHNDQPFDLDYDVLEVDPDYLVTGQTSGWLQLYDEKVITDQFRTVVEFGPYILLQRIRDGSSIE